MRFKDEKMLWHSDVKVLSERLANKSQREVYNILCDHDVIKLRSDERPKTTVCGRLMFPVVITLLLPVALVKWVMTGDLYLDTWIKKQPWLGKIVDYIGVGQ